MNTGFYTIQPQNRFSPQPVVIANRSPIINTQMPVIFSGQVPQQAGNAQAPVILMQPIYYPVINQSFQNSNQSVVDQDIINRRPHIHPHPRRIALQNKPHAQSNNLESLLKNLVQILCQNKTPAQNTATTAPAANNTNGEVEAQVPETTKTEESKSLLSTVLLLMLVSNSSKSQTTVAA